MTRTIARSLAITVAIGLSFACAKPAPQDPAGVLAAFSAGGLRPVEWSGFRKGWIRSGVSFGDYDSVWLIQRPFAYRHPPRPAVSPFGSDNYALPNDLEARLQAAARQIFEEELTESGRWQITRESDPRAMAVIIWFTDVIVHAPLRGVGGDDLQWIGKVADVTVVIEVFDSNTGNVMARLAERRPIKPISRRPMRATAGPTIYEMRRAFRGWAQALGSFIGA